MALFWLPPASTPRKISRYYISDPTTLATRLALCERFQQTAIVRLTAPFTVCSSLPGQVLCSAATKGARATSTPFVQDIAPILPSVPNKEVFLICFISNFYIDDIVIASMAFGGNTGLGLFSPELLNLANARGLGSAIRVTCVFMVPPISCNSRDHFKPIFLDTPQPSVRNMLICIVCETPSAMRSLWMDRSEAGNACAHG